jgi:citronellol/citronellal dehydrogenase
VRELTGKIAMITGASRGIGAATARRLAAEGASIALVARTVEPGSHRLPGSLVDTRSAIEEAGGTAIVVRADLSTPDFDADRLVDETESLLGPVDILVNNAGLASGVGLRAATMRDWDRALRVNVTSPWALAVRVVRTMADIGGGAIVNLTSVMGELPGSAGWDHTTPATLGSLYGATKAALNRWTVGLAAEVADLGIVVNALAPQVAVRTDGADLTGQVPLGRSEPIETMIEAVVALCSPATSEGTGQIRYSLEMLKRYGRPVYNLAGTELHSGWQPDDIPAALLRRQAL